VVKFEQNGSIFYQGVARAGELVNTTRVDEWRSDKTPEKQGYQRKPLPSHYNKIARYLVNEKKEAKLPTTILLNLRLPAKFREVKVVEKGTLGTLRLSSEDLKELYIVDGQHRVYGLKAAIEEFGEELYKDFPIPITIMEVAKKIDEVRQFHIINTTSKRVATDLSERLLKELAAKDLGEEQKLKREGLDWKLKAMEIVDILNSNKNSVWFERIQKPNEKKVGSVVVSQTSFVESLKPLLIPGGFLSRYSTASAAEAIIGFGEPFIISCLSHLKTPKIILFKKRLVSIHCT
jgi:DGQHR domain-containing protein